MRKRTTIALDMTLLQQAEEVLGTTRTTDTIHAALADVVRRHRRMSILDFQPQLDLADLSALRSHRFVDEREGSSN